MDNFEIIEKTRQFVQNELQNAEGGHDWWHIYRVHQLALQIAVSEGGNLLVIELAALLHDIADAKFHGGNESLGPVKTRIFLESLGVDIEIIHQVVFIVEKISFKGGFSTIKNKPIELQIVQDADRLDAIGAIGIARTFHYGGFKNREIYNPAIPPMDYKNREEYKRSESPTLNHFYEKLLKLKETMNTSEGKHRAELRHRYMEDYLEQFYKEWNAEI